MKSLIRFFLMLSAGLVLIEPLAAANVTYEFRATGDSTVIATIEFASPPASASSGWTSTDPVDLVSLFVDDTLFALGTGNVLDLFDDYLTYEVVSLDGSQLDAAPGIQDSTPGGAAGGISDFIQLGFSTNPGGDVIESFANANFKSGNWTVRPIPIPPAFALLASAVLGLGWFRRRPAVSGRSPPGC